MIATAVAVDVSVAIEEDAFESVRCALDAAHASSAWPDILEQVIHHVEHVESVCFYVNDKFLALIERFNNLIDSRNGAAAL